VLESKRTVVTIPNNFTIKKIHDLLSSIKRLNQFKEIRYIYEAEAVFFYILSKAKSQQVLAAEDILLFDMGGATINVTAVRYKLEEKVHHVEILSRKGYSIGGDSIDYFLQEHFLNRNISAGFPAIKELITEPKNFKNKALQLFTFHNGIKALKHEISENYHKGKKELLEINTVAREYEKFIDKATKLKEDYKAKLKAELDLLEDLSEQDKENEQVQSDLTKAGKKKTSYLKTYKVLGDFVKTGKDEKYNFLKEEYNKNLYNFYQNELFAYISDAITDAINESRKNKQGGESPVILKKVIISGRSTLFPNIRNLILEKMGGLQSLKANEIKDIMLTGSELKTAVAHGACWYGINRNNVHLDNFRSNAYFGVKETLDPQKTQVLFHPVIKPGQSYAFSENQAPSCENTIPFDSDFRFDDGLVEFYMAMGSDPLQDILNGRKEKYQMLRDIRPGTVVKSIKMKVSSNDEVKCMVKTVNGKTHEENPLMQNQDIHSSNNKHYTFWTDTE
jgi:hypothetical protein